MNARHLTEGHAYFTVEATACTIQKRGALAIICGDAPRRDDEKGTTSFSLRGPLLIMPPDIFSDEENTIQVVAEVLNENAARFFSSAKAPAPALGATAETRALRDLMAEAAQMREDDDFMQKPFNPSVAAALDRATRCLETACEPGSRSGAAIQ